MLDYQEKLKRYYRELAGTGGPAYTPPEVPGDLIVCTGYSGSGKTTFEAELEQHGFRVVNNDDIRYTLFRERLIGPEKEAKVVKLSLEIRDSYLSDGDDVIVTNCSPTNWFRELYLTTSIPVSRKMLLGFAASKEHIAERRSEGTYEFIDNLWEEPDLKAHFMQGVKYMEIDSRNIESLPRNVNLVLKELGKTE